MNIKVNGADFNIPSYKPLDDEMDQAYSALYTAFLNDSHHDLKNLVENILPPFKEATFAFFDRNATSNPLQDKFFSNLTIIWNQYFLNGRLGEAQAFWQRILQITREWEQQTNTRIHKGSAFYFWSVTAILQGELDKGFFLMHQAVEEDIATSGRALPNTPAFMFVTLNFQDHQQYFFDFVKSLADYLNQFFLQYQHERETALTIEGFRSRFLESPPSIHSVFSFTHSLSKLWRLKAIPTFALESEFSGQYELNTLFDLVLVIDEAIKSKEPNPAHWRFIDLAEFLATQSGLDVSKQDLIYAMKQVETSFDQVLSDLLDGTFMFEDAKTRSRLSCDLAIVYSIRNHAAHNLRAFPSVWKRIDALIQSVLNILLLLVDVLY